jgi:hypothetical protein
VTVGVSLAGINVSTFSAASVASGIAAASGVSAASVQVSITDLPVTSTISVVGTSATSLGVAQSALLRTAISTKAAVRNATNIRFGAPGALAGGRRRLLDYSVVVTVTGHGDNLTAVGITSHAFDSVNLPDFATAAGATTVAASAPAVTAEIEVTVVAADATASASVSSALSNSATLQQALVAAGVPSTVTVTSTPVVAAPPAALAVTSAAFHAGIMASGAAELLLALAMAAIVAAAM